MISLGGEYNMVEVVVGATRAAVDGGRGTRQVAGGSVLQPNDGRSCVYLRGRYGGCDSMNDILYTIQNDIMMCSKCQVYVV